MHLKLYMLLGMTKELCLVDEEKQKCYIFIFRLFLITLRLFFQINYRIWRIQLLVWEKMNRKEIGSMSQERNMVISMIKCW